VTVNVSGCMRVLLDRSRFEFGAIHARLIPDVNI
jgi:hypothetical protein